MDWRFGLTEQERIEAKVVEWNDEDAYGFCVCNNFSIRILVRESEIMIPCEEYFIPTDDIDKGISVGSWIEALVIETPHGLMCLGARKLDEERNGEFEEKTSDDGWDEYVKMPRLIGVVQHYNFEKGFGFIKSDLVRSNLFFNKKEILVPYEFLNDPYKAISYGVKKGELVTFQSIRNPRGVRAVAVKKLKGE